MAIDDYKMHKEQIVKELSRNELEERYMELYEKYTNMAEKPTSEPDKALCLLRVIHCYSKT